MLREEYKSIEEVNSKLKSEVHGNFSSTLKEKQVFAEVTFWERIGATE